VIPTRTGYLKKVLFLLQFTYAGAHRSQLYDPLFYLFGFPFMLEPGACGDLTVDLI
jgi:hypothetical protein